jgi:hypothetical protein
MSTDARDSSRRPQQGLVGPGLLVLLLGILTYLVYKPPLETSRPPVAPSTVPPPHAHPGLKAKFARMWEDPLSDLPPASKPGAGQGADDWLPRWLNRARGQEEDTREKIASLFQAIVAEAREELVCMPVLLPEGPYEEDMEKRMRIRYAVLTTLASRGYVLSYPTRMSYLELTVHYYHQPPGQYTPIRIVVPVKLFQRDLKEREPVLVLWVNQNHLGSRPLEMLAQILDQLFGNVSATTDGKKPIRVSIIGPVGSDALSSILTENEHYEDLWSASAGASAVTYAPVSGGQTWDAVGMVVRAPRIPRVWDHGRYTFGNYRKPTLYSPRATVSADAPEWTKLMWDCCQDKIKCVAGKEDWKAIWQKWQERGGDLQPVGVKLVRVIGEDDQLVQLLLAELGLRGAWSGEDPEEHIVLVAEHDTLYGRTLPASFCKRMKCLGKTNLHVFKYLRGIDGKLPTDKSEPESTGQEDRDTRATDESPHGRAQLDYLRRLERQLLELQEELQHEGKGEITAIGVVGTDVYDKLLVLRALRKRFPRTWFFTTDMEAPLVDLKEYGHARNLLIASHFALNLHQSLHEDWRNNLQRDVPPFRTNYQTATALACLLAIRDPLVENKLKLGCKAIRDDPWGLRLPECKRSGYLKPLLFEIGRTGPYQLTIFDQSEDAVSSEIHPHSPRERLWLVGASSGARFYHVDWLAIAFICMVGCATLYFTGVRWLAGVLVLPPLALMAAASWVGRRGGRGVVWWLVWLACVAASTVACVALFVFTDVSWPEGVAVSSLLALLLAVAWASQRWSWVHEFLGGLLLQMCVRKKRVGNEEVEEVNWPVLLGVVLLVATAGVLSIIAFDHGRPNGEPFSLVEGISIWPSALIRYVAVVLGVFFLGRGATEVAEDRQLIGQEYFGASSAPSTGGNNSTWWSWIKDRARVLLINWEEEPREPSPEPDGQNRYVAVYREYAEQGRPRYDWLRVGLLTALYYLFGVSLFMTLGFPPRPYRGLLSAGTDFVILHGAVLLTVMTTFLALDATLLCRRFVRGLTRVHDHYPDEAWPTAPQLLGQERGFDYPPELMREILIIHLIAHHTKRVARLIYAPFVMVLLLAVARYPGWDYYPFPWSLVLLIALSLVVAVYSAAALRWTAERAREHILRRLKNRHSREAGSFLGQRVAQYRLAMEEIQQEKGGAFRSWVQDPLVKAVMIPIGGMGGVLLFERLLPLLL